MTWIFWILALLLLAFVVLPILARPFGSSPLVELCASIAETFGTTFELENGRLQFQYPYRDATVIVAFRRCERRSHQFYLEIRVRGQQPSIRCEIYPDGGREEDRSFLGMQDAEIGDKDFDRAFVIKTEDVGHTKDLLSKTVRQIIDDMKASTDIHDVYVSLDHLQLTASKRMGQSNHRDALHFIAKAVLLYDGIVDAASKIQVTTEISSVTAPVNTACQICGEPLYRKLVRCRSCRTLHHRDCWEYYGACSTYGCRQSRFVVVKSIDATGSEANVQTKQPKLPDRRPTEHIAEVAERPQPPQRSPRPPAKERPPKRAPSVDHERDDGIHGGQHLRGSRQEQERELDRRRHRRRRRRHSERDQELMYLGDDEADTLWWKDAKPKIAWFVRMFVVTALIFFGLLVLSAIIMSSVSN